MRELERLGKTALVDDISLCALVIDRRDCDKRIIQAWVTEDKFDLITVRDLCYSSCSSLNHNEMSSQ